MSLSQFAFKVEAILDEAEKGFEQLFKHLNKVTEQKVTTRKEKQTNQQSNQIDPLQNPSSEEKVNHIKEYSEHESNPKKLKLGQLTNKKQQLMKKLRQVDRQLLQCKFQSSLLKQTNQSQEKKYTLNLQQQYAKIKNLNPLKGSIKLSNSHRTLDILEQFNKEKIRRHEEIIHRMKIRQQEQIKKIQALEQRKIKIELKRNQATLQNKENNHSFVNSKLTNKPK